MRVSTPRSPGSRVQPVGLLLVLAAALCPAEATSQSAMPPHGGFADAQRTDGPMPVILPLRERAAVIDRWLERRLETVAPEIMRREGVDLWIVAAREYNEDPVIETMLPSTYMAARRRTVLILHDRGPGQPLERLAVARYDIGPFPRAWDPESEPDQWGRVAEVIAERDPQRISVNRSNTFALADGLTGTEYDDFMGALPFKYRERVVPAERLAIGWLETRTPEEMEVYPQIVRIAHRIIAEGFSAKVIQPGVTTTEDVVWWYRERILELKLATWFQPSVSVQRHEKAGGAREGEGDFSARPDENVIRPGDLLHVDFGIKYLRLKHRTRSSMPTCCGRERTRRPRASFARWRSGTVSRTSSRRTSPPDARGTRSSPARSRRLRPKASMRRSTRIRSASTGTGPGPRSVSGTTRAGCRGAATIRSSRTQRTRSNSTPPSRCRSGADRRSESCSRRTRSSTVNARGTSTGARPTSG